MNQGFVNDPVLHAPECTPIIFPPLLPEFSDACSCVTKHISNELNV